MSLKNIAQAAGVSVSTVSRALQGSSRISEEKRREILEIARAQGYIDTRVRKATQAGLHSIVLAMPEAMLQASETNFTSWRILEKLRSECARRGIRVDPVISPGDRLDPERVMQGIAASDAEAIVVHFDENPALIARLAAEPRPAVLLFGLDPSSRISSVGIGNTYSTVLGTQHLLDLGHRDILLLSWPGRFTIRRREAGFREALREQGLDLDETRILRLSGFAPDIVDREFGAWIAAQGPRLPVTAVLCLSDNIAIRAMHCLQAAGHSVPGDVSVMGFDDSFAGQMSSPPLTSIRPPLDDIAVTALEELELALRRPGSHLARRIELGCQISLRESCAPPR
ncbi:LacI family DNA-binding transcriptional regulator [Poseidonocella sp. HB161398]|uniref:LacI family DNA-binding transcriptional regulator n=1 Tax=Poseidonocella sp. HB161398 TaxID=2320855 RepID=UPI001109F957|nr:LacI family DNA-binding transcriptional regulator [Poseidonocella sp. HB161398]